MKKTIVMFMTVLAIAATADVQAVTRSGQDLLTDCRNLVSVKSLAEVEDDRVLGMGYCIGLIDGFVTFNYVYETVLAAAEEQSMVQMCLPERVSTRQLAEKIVGYLERHPERMTESGQALAAQALIDAYPCSDKVDS